MTQDTKPSTAGQPVSIHDCRVLIVDDNQHNRQLINAILHAVGFINQEFACDGAEGLSKTASFKPDIIILDIMMPKVDGLEFMRRLRGSTELGTVPILVQTALSSVEDRNKIFAAGATDMLVKPISSGELITRVSTHLANRRLTLAYQDRLRLEVEVNAARQMQDALLPPSSMLEEIMKRSSLRIHAFLEPSSELGGDLWGAHILDDSRTGIFTFDFSGHGVGASLNAFRLHAIMSNLRPMDGDPAHYLSTLSEQLKRLLPVGQFATMFYGIIDVKQNSLDYAAAGAPFPLIGREDCSDMDFHDASGVPLGLKKNVQYKNCHVDFPPGAFLFLYSDALIETPDASGINLDNNGVKNLLRKSLAAGDAELTLKRLMKRFHKMAAAPPSDDLTMVLAMRKSAAHEMKAAAS